MGKLKRLLMITISPYGWCVVGACTRWNHPYECQVGMLVWDRGGSLKYSWIAHNDVTTWIVGV